MTFTQAEVDALISKEKARAVAKATKGIPDEAELNAFRTWKENQQSERDKWERLTGEREVLSGKLTAAENERDQLKRDLYVLKKGLSGEEAEFIAFKAGKMVDDKTTFEPWTHSPLTARRPPLTGPPLWAEESPKREKMM